MDLSLLVYAELDGKEYLQMCFGSISAERYEHSKTMVYYFPSTLDLDLQDVKYNGTTAWKFLKMLERIGMVGKSSWVTGTKSTEIRKKYNAPATAKVFKIEFDLTTCSAIEWYVHCALARKLYENTAAIKWFYDLRKEFPKLSIWQALVMSHQKAASSSHGLGGMGVKWVLHKTARQWKESIKGKQKTAFESMCFRENVTSVCNTIWQPVKVYGETKIALGPQAPVLPALSEKSFKKHFGG